MQGCGASGALGLIRLEKGVPLGDLNLETLGFRV